MSPDLALSPRLRFFTAAEVADILKMNVQVIARKLAAAEMEGYKLGKDWRVSEEQLLRFLEESSNRGPAAQPEAKILRAFFDGRGKLKSIPTARAKRFVVLRHLVSKLKPNRVYSEAALNEFLEGFHPDVCTLRRELVGNRLMVRKAGRYKVVTWNRAF